MHGFSISWTGSCESELALPGDAHRDAIQSGETGVFIAFVSVGDACVERGIAFEGNPDWINRHFTLTTARNSLVWSNERHWTSFYLPLRRPEGFGF
jgi:hypothetical protein